MILSVPIVTDVKAFSDISIFMILINGQKGDAKS